MFEDRPLSTSVLQAIPTEVGLWKASVIYSCLEANEDYIVIGSEQGHVWVVDLDTSKLIREYSVSLRGVLVCSYVRGTFIFCCKVSRTTLITGSSNS